MSNPQIHFNKSFSHSAARYRERRIHRVFGKGISADFSRWEIIYNQFKSWLRRITKPLFRPKTASQTPITVQHKFDHRMDAAPYLTRDIKHRTQHKH